MFAPSDALKPANVISHNYYLVSIATQMSTYPHLQSSTHLLLINTIHAPLLSKGENHTNQSSKKT